MDCQAVSANGLPVLFHPESESTQLCGTGRTSDCACIAADANHEVLTSLLTLDVVREERKGIAIFALLHGKNKSDNVFQSW